MITDITHFHMFFGLGSGAAGFQDARPEIPRLQGRMVCLGGMDVDPAGAADFRTLVGVPGTVRDLFSRQQYAAWHGREPDDGWIEAGPADVRTAAQHRTPDIVFLSAPCKGFSGLLPAQHAKTARYQALNELTLRGVWLMLEAWADDPVPVILFENVPRIATRGRHLLDQITGMLRHYGYVVRETTHDCGELGGLAQSRKRFLLIARHTEKVQPFIYEPPKRPLRAVGEVLGRMPLPGEPAAGPMHRVPSLAWKTWVRLAFVEAGSDWRSLNKLAVENGHLRDFLIVPEGYHGMLGVQQWGGPSGTISSRCGPTNGMFSVADPRTQLFAAAYGVNEWNAPAGTVAGESLPSNGRFAVADPRFDPSAAWKDGQAYGVRRWEDTSGAISGVKSPGQGAFSVADPRHHGPPRHSNVYRIVPWADAARCVTSAHGSGQCVADPRTGWPVETAHGSKLRVLHSDQPAYTVTGSRTGSGGQCIADPRPGIQRGRGDHYLTGGHYGVVNWEQPSGAVSASACHDNGRWSVADPRPMPAYDERLVCRITALDGTWHRPFTTLELAALQSIYDPDDYAEPGQADPFVLHGASDQLWRERIGNAVPRKAARAIADEIGRTILLGRTGETFQLSSTPIWVRPIIAALSVRGDDPCLKLSES